MQQLNAALHRKKKKVLGSVNSNHNHNPKHITTLTQTLTLILTLGAIQVLRNARGGGWVYAQALRSVTRGWGGGYVRIT